MFLTFLSSPPYPRLARKSMHAIFTRLGVRYVARVFTPRTLYGKNVLCAFQRWLSGAEQPCVKLCPVQSAEVKLTEMNTFYNYIHRQSSWHSCTAELHRCCSWAPWGFWFMVPCVKVVVMSPNVSRKAFRWVIMVYIWFFFLYIYIYKQSSTAWYVWFDNE